MLSTSSRVANRYAKLSSMLSVSSKKQRKDPKMPRWKIVHTRTADTNRPADTASRANANTSRWISNQMIPSPGCSRQSLQHYEADLPRSREWSNCAATFRLPPIQNSTRGRSFHPSHCETSQHRHVHIFLPRSLRKWEK